MLNLNLGFYLCDTSGFLKVMYFIRLGLNIVRFVVPIIVIAMIVMDLIKNVINPNDKEGMKKIVNRIVAAVIVFLVPTLINLVVSLIGYLEVASDSDTDYTVSNCYANARMECIQKIEDYLDCKGYEGNENSACQTFRRCNSYKLDNTCNITTVLDDVNCKTINKTKESNFENYNNVYTKFALNINFSN